jgi:mono/diheme cytochrome c family protein
MRKAWLAISLLGLGGCNWWYNDVPSPDALMQKIPWFDHMILSKAIQPYQGNDVPRNTPIGAVPVGGGEADWHTGDPRALVYMFDTVYAKRLVRPAFTPRPDSRSGEELYNTYCAVCHGPQGTGAADAPIREMGALSLLTAKARAYNDGYLYSMVRYGRLLMPQYGDKIVRIDERWAVVDYVRSLQAKAPVAAPPGAPTPAVPARKGAP